MVEIGRFNKMKVVRRADFGFYLDAETGKTSDDILLPNKSALGKDLDIGDEVEAFVYRDSSDRIISTLKKPLAQVGELAYLKVTSKTKIGSFVSFGLEKDILVPFKEENYKIELGKEYLFYIYLDKSGRLAATTHVDKHLQCNRKYAVGEEVAGTVYGFQTNGSAMVAVDNKYKGVILRTEYFTQISPGEVMKLRIVKYYEDDRMGLSPRQVWQKENEVLEGRIIEYLNNHNGVMIYNDKSSPEDIRRIFDTSKNYFKNALGRLMKKDLIVQDEDGTRLK